MIDLITPPLVSVIIPTYKRTETKKAVDSVLAQDYPNIEIIVVDDNAEHPMYRQGVLDSLAEYITSGKIKLLQNDRNLGGALSRNEGITVSTGEYIAFLDDDDVYLQGKIRKQVEKLKTPDAAMVYCFCVGKDAEGNLLFEAMTECIANTSLIMCKREALFSVGLFSDVPCKQDVLLELKLASHGYGFACVPEILVEYCNAQESFARISGVKKTTLVGFSAVRAYARENYDKLTPTQRKEVELDTSDKMCMVAKQLGDWRTYRAELRNMLKNDAFDIRTIKTLVKPFIKKR